VTSTSLIAPQRNVEAVVGEIALGLDTQEGVAFGSTWDALELQYK